MCRPELCEAAVRRDDSVVRSAIAAGEAGLCDCVCDATTGDTLLHVTACSEAVAFAVLLLDPPLMCDVDVMDADGGSPLHEAAGCCNAPMAFVSPNILLCLSHQLLFRTSCALEPTPRNSMTT